MFGLLHANALLYESWATGRTWPEGMPCLRRSPRVPLRGIYTHLLYGHAYPWAPRGWSEPEHRLFLELLAGLGYNVQMVTPGIGVMETPLTDLAKEGLDSFLCLRDDARRDLGMEIWPGDAANEVTYEEDPVPLFERGLGSAQWVDPGDPERLNHILDNRQELFRYWPGLDAFWVIDGDPGGYPGSPAEDFVGLLLGLRERMDRARPEGKDAALVYWQWTTWSPDLDENTGIPVLRMLRERMQGRWYVMVSNESSLRNAREADVLDHAIYFPYHLVEFEPHGPFTNPRFEDIRTEVNRGIDGGARQGAFCNAMSPLIQLPNIAYFGECLWHPAKEQPEGAAVMRRLAAQVIPEHADVLAAAWLALEADPSSALVPQAKASLDTLLARDSSGIVGPWDAGFVPVGAVPSRVPVENAGGARAGRAGARRNPGTRVRGTGDRGRVDRLHPGVPRMEQGAAVLSSAAIPQRTRLPLDQLRARRAGAEPAGRRGESAARCSAWWKSDVVPPSPPAQRPPFDRSRAAS